MPSRHDIASCLADIIENLERIQGYVAGMDREQFKDNGLVRDAAHRLGADASTLMPGEPWGDIRGIGNRLRHAYDRINLDLVWNTVRARLPALEADTRQALKGMPDKSRDTG